MDAKTYISHFENNTKKHGSNTAVIYEDMAFTYAELNDYTEMFCSKILQNTDYLANSIISIHLKCPLDIMVSILSILKADCTFLVIDVETPCERIHSILEDSRSTLIITDNDKFDYLNKPTIKIAEYLMNRFEERIIKMRSSNDNIPPAYAVYTSGSTGKPKGVLISNESLLNYCNWLAKYIEIGDSDNTLLLSSFAFDLGYTAVFPTLLVGGTLHLMNKEKYLSIDYVIDYIYRNRISFLKLTPTYYSLLVNSKNFSIRDLSCLRILIFGGESIIPTHIIKTNKMYPNLNIVNHYGPCEATIGTIANYVKPINYEHEIIPLGKPIDNAIVILLDQDFKIIRKKNIEGEIYIGGKGLSLGYINNRELTKEKFVTLLHNGEETLFYKTGDIGYYIKDNNICFSGRFDRQIKLNGYRVELDEIEKIISSYTYITKVAVVVQKSSNKIIVFYISDHEVESKHLYAFLKKKLPSYMLPRDYYRVENMPTLGSGKVDYNKLLQITDKKKSNDNKSDDINDQFFNIWSKHIDGDNNNESGFFDLGGDSLQFVMMLSEIDETFHIHCPYYLFAQDPSYNNILRNINSIVTKKREIKTDSAFIDNITYDKCISSVPLSLGYNETNVHRKELMPTQKFQLLSQRIVQHIVPKIVRLENSEVSNIENILLKIINTNLLLRSKIDIERKQLIVCDTIERISLLKIDLSDYNEDGFKQKFNDISKTFYLSFDFSKEFMYRMLLVKIPNNVHLLLVFMSHLITDGNVKIDDLIRTIAEHSDELKYDAYIQERIDEEKALSHIKEKQFNAHFTQHFQLVSNLQRQYPEVILEKDNTVDISFNIKYDFTNLDTNFVIKFIALVSAAISRELKIPELPINLFYSGRQYENKNNYFDLVGDLHDNYLLNINGSLDYEAIQEQVKSQFNILGYKQLNNTNILLKHIRNNSSAEFFFKNPSPIIFNLRFAKNKIYKGERYEELAFKILQKNKKSTVQYIGVGDIDSFEKTLSAEIKCNKYFEKHFQNIQETINKYLKR